MTTRSQGDLLIHWRQGPDKTQIGTWSIPLVGFTPGDLVQTNVASVNLRATPSSTGTLVASMPSGQQLHVTGRPMIIDGFTYTPVKYAAAATSGWASAAGLTLVTAGAATQYIEPALLTPIIANEEGIANQLTNLRELPDTSATVIRQLPVGTLVELTGINSGTWREVNTGLGHGFDRGWVLASSFSFRGETMPAFPAFTHRYTWHLKSTTIGTYLDVQYALQAAFHDPRGWQRTGVRIDQVSDEASATMLVMIVPQCLSGNPAEVLAQTGTPLTSSGRVASADAPTQDVMQLRADRLHHLFSRLVQHEQGHALCRAYDTYDDAGWSFITPANHFSIMGNKPDRRGLYHNFPDADDISSVKDSWLAGNAPNYVWRP